MNYHHVHQGDIPSFVIFLKEYPRYQREICFVFLVAAEIEISLMKEAEMNAFYSLKKLIFPY